MAALSVEEKAGIEELAHKELQSPGEVTTAFLKAVDADSYGKAMKTYLNTKGWPDDPKI